MKKNLDYKERRISVTKLVAVFAMATLLFILGFMLGKGIVDYKQSGLLSVEESLKLNLVDLELQERITKSNPCSNYLFYTLGGEIDNLARKLVLLEGQLGKEDERVVELKKPYTLLIVRHFLLMNERMKNCNENYTIILFFYSNEPNYLTNGEKQGYILNYLSEKYGIKSLRVYSIDSDLNLGVISTLKEVYNITKYPTVVVNGKVLEGLHTKEEIEREIQSSLGL
ncbi:MAG: hypothetical protein V1663_04515 [archaeon]